MYNFICLNSSLAFAKKLESVSCLHLEDISLVNNCLLLLHEDPIVKININTIIFFISVLLCFKYVTKDTENILCATYYYQLFKVFVFSF